MATAAWTLGAMRRSASAVISGTSISGITFMAMVAIDVAMGMSVLPISENRNGAVMATIMLLMSENVASRGTLPPSIPVITGAAVAVGQNMHMKVPWATSTLSGDMAKNRASAPNSCMDISESDRLVTRSSLGLIRQNVMNSIMKIRYGAINSTLSIKLWNNIPNSMAIGNIQGLICVRKFDFVINQNE